MKVARAALCLVLVFGSLFVAIPSAAAASELIVNPSDPAAPYQTIQDALDAASPGDIITVYPGNYAEDLWIYTENLTIRAFDSAQTTRISLSTLVVINVFADGLTLDGLELDAENHDPQARTISLQDEVKNFTARNCTFANAGMGIHIFRDITGGNIAFDNCTFSNLFNGIDQLSGANLTDSALTVTNCSFSDTGFDSIGIGGGIMGSEITIANNSFSEGLCGISFRGSVGSLSSAPTVVKIEDNVFLQYTNQAILFAPDADLENGDIFIRGNQMTNCLSAVTVSGVSVNMDMEISNNTFSINNLHTLPYMDTAIDINSTAANELKINHNTISGLSSENLLRGIEVFQLLGGNVSINDNTLSYCQDAILLDSLTLTEYADIKINGNTLSNNKNSIAIGPPSGSLALAIEKNHITYSEVGVGIDRLMVSATRLTPCQIRHNLFWNCDTALQIAEISADIQENVLVVEGNDFYDNTTGLGISTINLSAGLPENLILIQLNNFSGNNTPLAIGAHSILCLWNWWNDQYPSSGVYTPWMMEEILRMDYPDLEMMAADFAAGQQSVEFDMGTKLIFTLADSMNDSMIMIANVSSPGGTAPAGTQAAGIFQALNCSSNLQGTPTRIEVDCTNLPANLKNSDLRLYRFNPATSQWDALTSGYDSATDTLWAEVTDFSIFGAFGVLNEEEEPEGPEEPEEPGGPGELPATDGRTIFALAGIGLIILGIGTIIVRRKIA